MKEENQTRKTVVQQLIDDLKAEKAYWLEKVNVRQRQMIEFNRLPFYKKMFYKFKL